MSNQPTSPHDAQNRNKKIKVALMGIAAIIIFYVGANFLKGINVFNKTTTYYCVLDDASGIQQSTPVLVSGYKIGAVQKVKLMGQDPVRVCAEILFNEDIDIPNDSRFIVASRGILDGPAFNLAMGTSTSYYQSGDTIPYVVEAGLMEGIGEMKSQIASVLASVDTIGLTLKDVLHKEGGGESLKLTLDNIVSSTEHLNNILAQNENKVGQIVTDIEKFTQTLNDAAPQLTSIINNFDQLSDTLAKADIAAVIYNANQAVKEVETLLQKVNSGEGTVGSLINEDGVAQKLETSIQSLDALLKDLKENPSRYVHFSLFGKPTKTNNKNQN